MTGMNASVSAGWYTFTNLGPLTTTFTPAPSCSASNRIGLGYLQPESGDVVIELLAQCTSQFDYFTGCIPSTTTKSMTTPTPTFTATSYEGIEEYMENMIDWAGGGAYYSPGLYCPSGWTTVGMAARDASSSLTSSGILVPTPSTTTTKHSADDYYYYMMNHEDPASVLKGILEPRQTMAMCCPSAMTADSNGGCYSIVEDYTPTYGCQVTTGYDYKYSSVPYTYTFSSAGITDTGYRSIPTATVYETGAFETTLDRAEQTELTALSYASMITLLYHESDLQSASKTASASATATTTSNAAGRVITRTTGWDGFASVLGIWTAATLLGVAIIFPW